MALFPRIQTPCPYADRLDEVLVGSNCTKCQRQVHDITALDDAQRIALVASCADEICVSYRLSAKAVLAAAALGAGFGMAGAAAAATSDSGQGAGQAVSTAETEDGALGDALDDLDMQIIVGGLRAPHKAVWVNVKKPAKLAELPVVYEAEPVSAAPPKSAQKEARKELPPVSSGS